MENRRKKIGFGEMFSFPNTPTIQDQDSDFEFGCVTPDSPYKNSPADHLFFNGKLLPHAFPIQPTNTISDVISRTTSRASSVSSKDSLMSSRSNSTNSRSSSCSSARTSSSDSSERKLLYQSKVACKRGITRERYQGNKGVSPQVYGASQRWQFITPVPAVLNRETSRRKKGTDVGVKEELRAKKKDEERAKESPGFCRRFLRSFLSACRECHAMEPSKKDNELQKI